MVLDRILNLTLGIASGPIATKWAFQRVGPGITSPTIKVENGPLCCMHVPIMRKWAIQRCGL